MQENFKEWIKINWDEAGGLIRPSDAAKIVGVSQQAMSKAMHSGKIKMYKPPQGGAFVSLKEVLFYEPRKR